MFCNFSYFFTLLTNIFTIKVALPNVLFDVPVSHTTHPQNHMSLEKALLTHKYKWQQEGHDR